MSKRNMAFLLVILLCIISGFGCSSDATSGDDDGTTTIDIADLSLGVSSTYVSTDNSDNIIISASVVDNDNAAVSDALVYFASTGGNLSAASATTDESGVAEVTFSSGYVDKSNQQAVITAEIDGLTAQVPVSITGTTCDASATQTSLVIGGEDSDTLSIYVADAGGNPVYDAEVTLSLAADSTGSVDFSASSGQTDINGEFETTVTGTSSGSATVSVSAAGATASQIYSVEASSTALAITSPSTDPASMSTSETLTIVVSNPSPGSSTQVVLATTVGTLSYGGDSGSALTLNVSGGQVQATLSSDTAGTATITAYDVDSPTVVDTLMVAIYVPVEEAEQLTLQAGSTSVSISSGDTVNTVEVTAKVVDDLDDGVGGAPVVFVLENTTGGGEYISPSIVYTDTSGKASTTFYAGSNSSGAEGVTVRAYLLNDNSITDDISIVIGGTAGSVVIGVSTEIYSLYEETTYQVYVSVLVADTNGNPVSNADVSLSLWPTSYYLGYFVSDGVVWTDGPIQNEDLNGNTILDTYPTDEDVNGNGELDPGNSAAGTIDASVTTNEYGVATFSWTYLKSYAGFVRVDLSASTFVLGSETTTVLSDYLLRWEEGEEENLDPSPWGDGL